jgi:3-deoxy-D-manno-octulosonic-acid transferase
MGLVLNLLYLLAGVAASPWFLWQRLRHGKYREGWSARLLGRVPRRRGNARCLWLHAVSVGEVNLLAPILSRWEKLHPDWECVISTTTQSGYALAQKRYAPRLVFYLPLDFTWAVRRAMRRIRPDILALAELELWPNLIRAAKANGANVAVINGRLGERSFRRYQRIGWLTHQVLADVDIIAAQNEAYAERFRALGAAAERVNVTGSVKFDGAMTDRNNPQSQRLAGLAGIESTDVVFLAGSTQHPEEALAIQAFRTLASKFPALRLILVPRHPERFEEVARLLERSGLHWQRRSALSQEPGARSPGSKDSGHVASTKYQLPSTAFSSAPPNSNHQPRFTAHRSPLSPPYQPPLATHPVLLVDVVGELAAWWGLAQIAFVGGSMGNRGGQNMIEPAAFGAAVSFGPNTWNFRDVVSLLLADQAAVVVSTGAELTAFVGRCLADPEYAQSLGRRARELVQRQVGASDRTIELLERLAGGTPGRRIAA